MLAAADLGVEWQLFSKLNGSNGSNTEIGDSVERSSISDKVVEAWMAEMADK